MGAVSRAAVSPYDAQERLFVVEPYGWGRDQREYAVIFHHAANVSEFAMWEQDGHHHVVDVLAEQRPLVSPLGRSTLGWGNDLTIAKTGEAYDYGVEHLGALPGRVVLAGTSGGFTAACNWARQNLDRVALILGFLPLVDLGDIHANNRNGSTASIDTAYGGSYVDAVDGLTHNPTRYAAELAEIPIRLFYSGVDAAVPLQTVLGFVDAVGENARAVDVDNAGLGHDVRALAGVSQPWLRRLLAAWA